MLAGGLKLQQLNIKHAGLQKHAVSPEALLTGTDVTLQV